WLAQARLATLSARLAVRQELDARVSGWTQRRSATEAAALLQAAGVSAIPVDGPAELRGDPHLAARHAFASLHDPEIGPVLHVANPLRLGRTPLVPGGRAPRLGEHTEGVLSRVLGLSVSEVRRLVEAGVCW